MRCRACDVIMSDEDICRKFPADEHGIKEFSDMCKSCHDESVDILYGNYTEPEYYKVNLNGNSLYSPLSMSELQEDGA